MSDFAILCAPAPSASRSIRRCSAGRSSTSSTTPARSPSICSNKEQLDKILEIRSHVPTLNNIIVCDPPAHAAGGRADVQGSRRRAARSARRRTARAGSTSRARRASRTIWPRSSTPPARPAIRRARCSRTATSPATSSPCATFVPFAAGDIALSILPLSHILERMVDFLYLYKGGCIAYAENVTKVADNLQESASRSSSPPCRASSRRCARACMDNVATAPPARQKIFHWALKVAEERLPYIVDAQADAARAEDEIRHRGQARLQQDHRAPRRQREVRRLRRRAALRRARGVLHRRGRGDPRGLRPHRDLAGHRRESSRQAPPRHGRSGHPRRRSEDRRRRRDPLARPAHHEGLLEQPRGDGAGDRSRTAGSTPATSARSTRTASSRSPTARRTSSSTPTARTSRRSRSRRCSRALRTSARRC